jgi:hypothetical protein
MQHLNSKRRLARGILIAIVLALNASVPPIMAHDTLRPSWLRYLWLGIPLSIWAGIALLVLIVSATWIYSRKQG